MDRDKMTFSVSLDELSVQALAVRSIPYIENIVQQLNDLKPIESENDRLIAYQWSIEAKNVVILIRDAMLELLKLEQYLKDNWRTAEVEKSYKTSLQSTIHDATFSLLHSLEVKLKGEGNHDVDWLHQVAPHQVIIKQIRSLEDQIKMIQRSQHKIYRLDTKLANYKTGYRDFISQRNTRLDKLYQLIVSINESVPSKDKIIEAEVLDDLVKSTQSAINHLETLSTLPSYDHIVLEDVDKLKVPVSKNQGRLVYKTVEILSEVSGWSSFQVDNPLKAVDARIHSFTEQVRSGLFQILNRLKAKVESTNQDLSIKRKDALYPIEKLMSEYKNDLSKSVVGKLESIREDIDKHIQTSQIFSDKHNFLPTITIDQVANFSGQSVIERRYNWNNIKLKAEQWTRSIFSKYTDEEQLSASGYIDRVLSFDPESDVNALFLRKGFLGSSFTIDRVDIIRKIKNHFRLWNEGYGGALILKGGHGTGKTTILEMLPIMYPDVPSFHIINDQKLEVNGYKIDVQKDLNKAIKHIVKYSGNSKCIVTIDDIGNYSNSPESTFELITNLLRTTRKHTSQIYFAVTMHTYLVDKIEHYFNIQNPFNEVLSVDYMPSANIQEAVMIRAQAVANLDQLDKESETISSIARKVSRRARNNIGRGMQLWCMMNGGYQSDNGDLKFRVLVKENEELLNLLFANGLVYEPYLRSMLNDIDAASFKSNIKYLLRIKLLEREGLGYIKVNPYLQSTIEAIIN